MEVSMEDQNSKLSPVFNQFINKKTSNKIEDAIIIYKKISMDKTESTKIVHGRTAKLRQIKSLLSSREDFSITEKTKYLTLIKKTDEKEIKNKELFSFYSQLGIARIRVTPKILEELVQKPEIEAIIPNQKINPIKPTRIEYGELSRSEKNAGMTWGLNYLGIDDIWSTTKGKGITVAVIDTGVFSMHPDLENKVWKFMLFDPLSRRIRVTPEFDSGSHGTHVCGIIAGGNSSGVAIGIAPEVNLIVGAALIGETSLLTLIESLIWSAELGADIINMSLGFTRYEPKFSLIMNRIVHDYGILPIVSIGNENHGNTSCPGNCPESFAVGALEKVNRNHVKIASFSSGATLIFPGEDPDQVDKPDVVAPGLQIWSSIPPKEDEGGFHSYAYYDGTSMAAPHVSGSAALLMSARPSAPVTEIMKVLKETAFHPEGNDRRPDNRFGWGAIRPVEALKAL